MQENLKAPSCRDLVDEETLLQSLSVIAPEDVVVVVEESKFPSVEEVLNSGCKCVWDATVFGMQVCVCAIEVCLFR